MAKSEKIALLIVSALLLALLAMIILRATSSNEAPRVYRFSVITDDAQGDSSQNIRKGLDRAARDYNVDLQIIALHGGLSEREQTELLLREIEAGADAILFSMPQFPEPARHPGLSDATVPIISIGTVWNSPAIACSVSSDNAAVGRMLANEMLEDGVTECFVRTSLNGARIDRRLQGLKEVMAAAGVRCSLERDASAAAWTDIPLGAAVAALDEPAIGKLAAGPLAGRVAIYGVGCTNELLYYMEEGVIRRLIVEDGYAMGYLAVRSAVEKVESSSAVRERIVACYAADAEHLYEEPLRHVLFPIS